MCCSRPGKTISTGTQYRARPSAANSQPGASVAVAVGAGHAFANPVFEYVGATALTIVSPLTRKTYRFERPGARVEVDVRDRSWVAFAPNLTLVG